MMNLIRNIFKLCRVSKANPDTGNFPIGQIQYWGKTGNAHELYPYGLAAVAPEDSLGYVFIIQGQEENRAYIPFSNSNERLKNLKPGEVALFNALTQTSVILKQNGDIVIDCKGNSHFTTEGNQNLNPKGGTININAVNTNLGSGGLPIARLGDAVQVIIAGVPYEGTITSASSNNRST